MSDTINVLIGGGGVLNRNAPHRATLPNGKPQCQGETYRKLGRFGEWGQCSRAGTHLEAAGPKMRGAEEGKLYYFCATHAPSKVAVRAEQFNQRHREELAKDRRKYAREDAKNDIIKALRGGNIEAAMAAFARHEENLD